MPYYLYRCPLCSSVVELPRSVDRRDEPLVCSCKTMMERQPTTASMNFVGSGWAKDGYSSAN